MANPFSIFSKKIVDRPLEGVNPEEDFQALINQLKINKIQFDQKKFRHAFDIILEVNHNTLHINGLPRYTHPLSVAMIVIREIPMDEDSILSALMHDIWKVSDKYDFDYIKKEFGENIAQIVDSLHKIRDIDSVTLSNPEKIENYRKFLIAIATDYRVILIKLADVLDNMRNIQFFPETEQKRRAVETFEIYNPFANRLGLRNLKWELDDLAFKILNPKEFEEISNYLAASKQQREEYIKRFIEPLNDLLLKNEFLKKNKVTFEINGRAKHIYSIYNKTILRGKPVDELYDLFAIRVILGTSDPYMCHYVYGLLASLYPPVPETFKDYIGTPKKNGYQSIHTAVFGLENKIVEIQIRTESMHLYSEQGIAAHFNYKSQLPKNSILENKEIQRWLDVVREIFENEQNVNPTEILEEVKTNLFADEIYVYSPVNEFITLPVNSTTLDYAYKIHTEIGDHYVGAKVNGKIVPIEYVLRNGDKVEIIVSNNAKPSEDWLNYVVTSKAKNHLVQYFKDLRKEKQRIGKLRWEKESRYRKLNLEESQIIKYLEEYNITKISEFYELLGDENIDVEKIVLYLKGKVMPSHDINTMGDNIAQEYFNKYSKDHVLGGPDLRFHKVFPNGNAYQIVFEAHQSFMLNEQIQSIFALYNDVMITNAKYDMNKGRIEGYITFETENQNSAHKILEQISELKEIFRTKINVKSLKSNEE